MSPSRARAGQLFRSRIGRSSSWNSGVVARNSAVVYGSPTFIHCFSVAQRRGQPATTRRASGSLVRNCAALYRVYALNGNRHARPLGDGVWTALLETRERLAAILPGLFVLVRSPRARRAPGVITKAEPRRRARTPERPSRGDGSAAITRSIAECGVQRRASSIDLAWITPGARRARGDDQHERPRAGCREPSRVSRERYRRRRPTVSMGVTLERTPGYNAAQCEPGSRSPSFVVAAALAGCATEKQWMKVGEPYTTAESGVTTFACSKRRPADLDEECLRARGWWNETLEGRSRGRLAPPPPQDWPQRRELTLRFGIFTGMGNTTWPAVLDLWRHAAASGWDAACVTDQFMPNTPDRVGDTMECWNDAGRARGRGPEDAPGHDRVRQHLPASRGARENGRAGGPHLGRPAHLRHRRRLQQNEHEAYGIPFYTVAERLARLDEPASAQGAVDAGQGHVQGALLTSSATRRSRRSPCSVRIPS